MARPGRQSLLWLRIVLISLSLFNSRLAAAETPTSNAEVRTDQQLMHSSMQLMHSLLDECILNGNAADAATPQRALWGCVFLPALQAMDQLSPRGGFVVRQVDYRSLRQSYTIL